MRGQGGALCLKAPEGDWTYVCERLPSLITFSPEYATKIITADLKRGVPGSYVIFNVRTSIFVYAAGLGERVSRLRAGGGANGTTSSPPMHLTPSLPGHRTRCAAWTSPAAAPPPRPLDTSRPCPLRPTPPTNTTFSWGSPPARVRSNLNTGHCSTPLTAPFRLSLSFAVRALSLSAQLGSLPANTRPLTSLQFNSDGSLTPARCVAAAWVRAGGDGTFITAHASGEVFLHRKIVGNSSDTRLLARTASETSLHPAAATTALVPPGGVGARVAAAAVAPAGDRLALACRDGALRILELPSGAPMGGFRSYYGGLLCCAWSPDGRLVAAGGEDDLVAVWAVEDRQMVAHLTGHTSWVAAVAFDGGWAGGEGAHRLASVGQDCRGILWELGGSELGSDATASPERRETSAEGDVEMEGSGSDAGSGGGGSAIAPALPRAEMMMVQPLATLHMHVEPLCDCAFLPDALLVAGADGSVKKFARPPREQPGGGGS